MTKREAEYYVEHRLKAPKSFFEWAYSRFPTYIWKNKSKTIKASKYKHHWITEKRLTKNSKLTFFDKRDFFEIILVTNKRVEIQTYEIYSEFVNGIQEFDTSLYNLEIFNKYEHRKISYYPYMGKYDFGHRATAYGMYSMQPDIFENNWRTKIKTNVVFKYINLDCFSSEQLGKIYKYRNEVEFTQKIGANTFARDIVNTGSGLDMRIVNFNWLKRNKQQLKNSELCFKDIELRNRIKKLGGKVIYGIEKYMDLYDLKNVPSEIGIVKLQNYLIKQECQFYYYHDYMNMLKQFHLKLDKSNLLPRDIKTAHDKLVEIINSKKREAVSKGFEKRAKDLQRLEIIIGKYVFVIPKTAKDLIAEGNNLHHCVGGSNYIQQHGSGETTIMFIRKVSDPDKSYFTMEYQDKRIVQVHGLNNIYPDENIQAAVDQWLEIANKKVNKAVAA